MNPTIDRLKAFVDADSQNRHFTVSYVRGNWQVEITIMLPVEGEHSDDIEDGSVYVVNYSGRGYELGFAIWEALDKVKTKLCLTV